MVVLPIDEITENTLLPVVCFASCEACPGGQGSESNVTFNVDMSLYADPFTTVYVSGDLTIGVETVIQ